MRKDTIMVDEFNKRLQVLEEKFEYQDRTIDALNDVVIDQQKQITALEGEIRRLESHLLSLQDETGHTGKEPTPPHY